MVKRTDRLNSLLKEVISETVWKEVKNPYINELLTITSVDVSKDLHHATVFVSVIGDDDAKQQTLDALNSASGFIAVTASKKVKLRYFPELRFKVDDSAEKHMRVDQLLNEIQSERKQREAE